METCRFGGTAQLFFYSGFCFGFFVLFVETMVHVSISLLKEKKVMGVLKPRQDDRLF